MFGFILKFFGSVGLLLFIWVVGMLIVFVGIVVYFEFGIVIFKNGGEKNYFEYVFCKLKFFIIGFYIGYVVFFGWVSGNLVVFGYVYFFCLVRCDVSI